jgi:8-oxo-dGTP diphosphatase
MAVYLVRHAVAVGRSSWEGRDADRPLTAKGRRQSAALVRLLEGTDLRRILTSPANRCASTVQPLADARRLTVKHAAALQEGARADEATALIAELARKGGDSVACTHGDLVPEILRRLARTGADVQSELLFAKGSTWELLTDGGEVVAARYHPPAE